MSKVKLLLDVVSDLRSLADSVQAVADAIASNGPNEGTKPEQSLQKEVVVGQLLRLEGF